MNLRKHGIVPCIAMLALVGATCTQPTYSVRPQPLRSIFTDYLDSWTRFVNTTLNSLPSHLEPVAADERLCLDHLHRLVTAAAQYQPWAMQMFDAMGKPTSGIMQESLSFLGLYSECVHSQSDHFRGQYCLANVILPESSIQQLQKLSGLSSNSWTNAQARIGLCFPSTCRVEQIADIGNFAISQLIANSSISLSNCYQRDDDQLETKDSMYFVVVSILFAFVALVSWATLFEYRLMKTTTPAKSVETNAADDDDASSVCTQCSKCSSGRCSSIGIGLTPSAIPAKAHSADLSMIENNNFLSHYQNGWCACPIESNDRQVSLVYPTLLESLCNNRPNSTSINHESRLTHLLASELCQTKSSPICTIISTTKDDCRAITVDTITPVKTDTEDHSRVVQLLLCFSALNNSRRLFNVSLAGGEDSIHCLHGIKFFCMLWIISGHSYSFAMQWLFFSNPSKIKEASTHLLSQVFANGTFSVDCFFFISGLLICLLGLKTMKANGGRFHLGFFYLHRYLRLTPLMLIVIAFSATIFRTIAEGPAWLESITMYDGWCRQNWWINALYLHNFINREQMCLSHSWYSAVDMQFYLVSPLLLIPLARWPRFGLGLLAFLFTCSVSVTAALTAINDYPAMPYIAGNVSQQVLNDYYGAIYIKPYCRIGPFLVGFLVGFLIFKKQNKIQIGPIKHVIYSILSIVTLLLVLFAMQGANNGIKPPILFAALYSALSRPLFCVCLAYLIVCFLSGKLRTLNALLSLPIIRPLSRVSYAAYLLHPVIIATFYGSREQVFYFSHYLMFYFIIGNLFITYSLSFVVSICFEMPFINISRLMMRNKQLK